LMPDAPPIPAMVSEAFLCPAAHSTCQYASTEHVLANTNSTNKNTGSGARCRVSYLLPPATWRCRYGVWSSTCSTHHIYTYTWRVVVLLGPFFRFSGSAGSDSGPMDAVDAHKPVKPGCRDSLTACSPGGGSARWPPGGAKRQTTPNNNPPPPAPHPHPHSYSTQWFAVQNLSCSKPRAAPPPPPRHHHHSHHHHTRPPPRPGSGKGGFRRITNKERGRPRPGLAFGTLSLGGLWFGFGVWGARHRASELRNHKTAHPPVDVRQ
jgi:hypothetical protein